MEETKDHLFFKEQFDRFPVWIGCSCVLHSIVYFVNWSFNSRFSSNHKRIIAAVIFVEVCCICLLIIKERFSKMTTSIKFLSDENKQKGEKVEIFPSTDEKYISSRIEDASSSLSSIPATSTSSHALLMETKQPLMVTSEASQSSDSFCDICMDTKSPSEMFSNATVCSHVYCSDCICRYVSGKVKKKITKVKCPYPKCEGVIGIEHCRSIILKEVLERWEKALCELALILGAHKFYCPFKDCSAMLVDDGGEAVTMSECPNCNRLFCAQCKVAWHSGMDCREFKSLKEDERNPEDIMVMQLAKNKQWKRCSNCNFMVEKRDGCHRISNRCGCKF